MDEPGVDPSVYAFSSISNLVHLLPDGFQGDTVRQVLAEDPALAARFEGFTLFTDHLGRYPGTAPSLYSMLTGRAFPLEKGFDYSWVGPETKKLSTRRNSPAPIPGRPGTDFGLYLPGKCRFLPPPAVQKPWLSPAPGPRYFLFTSSAGDLTLFRLSPLFLKEKIYDRGYWLLSDIATDEGSPKPDPILREWTEKLRVVDDRPLQCGSTTLASRVPPSWDVSCDLGHLEPVRDNYLAQAHCILNGIADFIERLKIRRYL